MTSKQNILLHVEGIEVCEQNDWLKGIAIFQQIDAPSAAIHFNIGCCYLQLKQFKRAEDSFLECVARDKYLAVGYYQLGVARTFMQHYTDAIDSFNSCLTAMRGNTFIHYKQLNLPCKMFASEVRLNLALIYLFTGDYESAIEELRAAVELENGKDHFVHKALAATVNENWNILGQSPTDKLITLSSSSLFHPSKAKLDGIKGEVKFKNSAKVVSATNEDYSFVGFVGPVKLQREKENLGEPKFPKSSSPVTPPLPSVAPPRIPIPTKPPPVNPPPPPTSRPPQRIPSPPSSTPPSLRKDIPPPPSSKPPSLTSPPKSEPPPRPSPKAGGFKFPSKTDPPKLGAALQAKFLPKGNTSSPKHRPPPPSKESLKRHCDCSLTLSLSIAKSKVKSYDDLVNDVASKLNQMANEVKSGRSTLFLSSDGTESVLDSSTWMEVFRKSAKGRTVQLGIKEKKSSPKRSPFLSNGKSPFSSKGSNDDDIYVDASFEGEEDDVYSTTVFVK